MQFEAYAPTKTDRRIALRSTVRLERTGATVRKPLTGKGWENRLTWIHVAPEGEWLGHPDGAFELNGESFLSCIRDAESRSTPIAVDYDHASTMPDGEPKPAAGYVHKLDLRSDGLYALVEFTERAAGYIKAGELPFCSGVFLFDAPDRKSGKARSCSLHSIALTINPFIDGQHPIMLTATPRQRRALSNHIGESMITREALEKALDELGADSLSPDQLMALIEGLEKLQAAASPEEAEPAAEEPAEEALASVQLADEMPAPAAEPSVVAKLAEALGMDEAAAMAALEANLDAVAALLKGEGAPMDGAALSATPTVKALSDSLAHAHRRLAAYEAQERKAVEAQLEAEVEALVTAGKIHPAKRSEIRALAVKSPAQFRALAAALAPVYPVGAEASAVAPTASESMSLTETVINEKDPRVVALNAEFDRAGVKDKAIRERHIRLAINKAG